MGLTTHSLFYYGLSVDSSNNRLDFDEGAGELTATLTIGDYTLSEIIVEVQNQLNTAGTLTYTVTVDRATRIITIAATGLFDLLITSGTHAGTSAYALLGYNGPDVTGFATYDSDTAVGFSYSTQFIIQDHISSDHFKKKIDATVNKSASGVVEVFAFGDESFIQGNLKFVNNYTHGPASSIRNRPTGVEDLVSLMDFLITKAAVEFMPNENDPNTFQKILLESTPEDSKGVGYKLRELYAQGLFGYFETGQLRFRVVE